MIPQAGDRAAADLLAAAVLVLPSLWYAALHSPSLAVEKARHLGGFGRFYARARC